MPQEGAIEDEALRAADIPLPRAGSEVLNDPGAWRAAQGQYAAQLAHAAMAVGQLDMAVAQLGPGAQERLALREVEALSWAFGMPISAQEIGRDNLQARAGTDVGGLHLARWAVRRLMGAGTLEDLRGFLGLHRSEQPVAPDIVQLRITGAAFDEAAAAFWEELARLPDAHAFTYAAYARHLWRLCDLSSQEHQIEAYVWASRQMATGCVALGFVPMGQGVRRLRGTNAAHLGEMFRVITEQATKARVELSQLAAWSERAQKRTASIRGETPARIIAALMGKPMATTEMIEQAAEISRDTAERLLARMHAMGLVREVTGAKRFRIWTAAV